MYGLLALYGPTSSGKTRLSVDLALKLKRRLGRDVVIISADSRQVYRHMDIGTSKTTPAQTRGVRHELIDVAEPDRKLELEEFSALARPLVDACLKAGEIPFVVGGTGVYVKSIIDGWDVDRVAPVRESVRRDFPRSMAADAHAMLRRLDRDLASRVHPNNYEAVVNALATVMAGPGTTATVPHLLLGLDPGARKVDERVASTYDDQVRRGLLAEVLALDARYDLEREFGRHGPDSPNQILHTHGYREYFEVAAERGRPVDRLDEHDLAEVRQRVVEHIRAYTRRQRSWFRKLPTVRMVRSAEQALSLVTATGPVIR